MIEKYRLRAKLCHYSVGEGLPLIRAAKARGLAVTAEVTPHHVFFDTAMLTEAIAVREGRAAHQAPLLCTVGKIRRIRVCREAIRDV